MPEEVYCKNCKYLDDDYLRCGHPSLYKKITTHNPIHGPSHEMVVITDDPYITHSVVSPYTRNLMLDCSLYKEKIFVKILKPIRKFFNV
jgi:hypothetical protein